MRTLLCCALLCLLSGCTGIELGGRLGVYRVDERQESQKTHNVPLACYLWRKCNVEPSVNNEGDYK
jgi:ligand-binding sensor domain-containing protein